MGLVSVLFLALPLTAAEGPEQWRELMGKSAQLLTSTDQNQAKLLFVKRREVQEFDSAGKVKTRKVLTTAREPMEDFVITRVIARDDKPVTPEERLQQDADIRKFIEERRASQAAAASASKKPTERAGEMNRILREIPVALDFKLVGTELIDGRPSRIFTFTPRPGYKPPGMKYRMFEKMRGKVWVDTESSEMVRVDAEVYDDLNIGFGVVGHIGKGSTFKMERRQMAPGVWVPTKEQIRMEARLMLVKNFRQEIVSTFSEFKPRPNTQTAQAR